MPSWPANAVKPPAALIARSKASLLMARNSSTALPKSQALLHCAYQAILYALDMTLGKRIKLARKRLGKTQQDLADHFGITDKAVSAWERDETAPEHERMPELRRFLQVPYYWLHEGKGDPPAPNDIQGLMDGLAPPERAAVRTLIETFHKQGERAG
jgi:transcriptional regulator with XRE-family HTH domain